MDPFRLTAANMLDAREHGAQVLTYHEVTDVLRQGDQVTGVQVYDHQNHRRYQLYAPVVVNAAGIWSQRIAGFAGVNISMLPAKGSLLILGHRLNQRVINRCRRPGMRIFWCREIPFP